MSDRMPLIHLYRTQWLGQIPFFVIANHRLGSPCAEEKTTQCCDQEITSFSRFSTPPRHS